MTLTELAAKHSFKPTGILHVGASMLEEAQQYEDLGVKTVIWVEALPETEQRTERAKKFGHVLHQFTALSDGKWEGILRVASNEVSSSILPFKRHSEIYSDIVVTKEIPIVTVRADEFFKDFPAEIDTLVLDVQGAELKVLKGLGKLMGQIQRAWLEVNLRELYEGTALKPELDDWMAKAGFPNVEEYQVHIDEWSEGFYWR